MNAICDYLKIIAQDSLQILSIHGFFHFSEPRDGSAGNLRGFEMLHTVELGDCLLLDASRSSLTHELPKSIQSFKLYHGTHEDCTIYREMLDELLENIAERLPNLQTLAISSLWRLCEQLSDLHYTTSLRLVGVELILKKEQDMPMERFHNGGLVSSFLRV